MCVHACECECVHTPHVCLGVWGTDKNYNKKSKCFGVISGNYHYMKNLHYCWYTLTAAVFVFLCYDKIYIKWIWKGYQWFHQEMISGIHEALLRQIQYLLCTHLLQIITQYRYKYWYRCYFSKLLLLYGLHHGGFINCLLTN